MVIPKYLYFMNTLVHNPKFLRFPKKTQNYFTNNSIAQSFLNTCLHDVCSTILISPHHTPYKYRCSICKWWHGYYGNLSHEHQNLKMTQETWTYQIGDHVHVPYTISHKNHSFLELLSQWLNQRFPHVEIIFWHSKCWTTYPSTVIIPCLVFASTVPHTSMTSPNLGKRKGEQ